MTLFTRILLSIAILGVFLFLYLNQHIEITRLRLQVPFVAKEVKRIQEENVRLQYDIDVFESPTHLIELSRKPEFSHLKYPEQDKILEIPSKVSVSQ